MYRAHSKDINRNKSFHPLTYGNLRRVEVLKEAEEERKQRVADRQKELQRDQEERRYDELVLANSADSLSGELARFRQTKNIFKAEYEADSARRLQEEKKDEHVSADGDRLISSSSSSSIGAFAASNNAFLRKFKKECHTDVAAGTTDKEEVKRETTDGSASPSSTTDVAHGKRPREDAGDDGKNGGATTTTTTGFVTSAEAARLRKELNLAQKQRHDPLLRVQQYQNSCVANAARQQQLQHQQRVSEGDASDHNQRRHVDSTAKDNSDALQSRIRELLALKKKR
jgi:hypothetical protein